MDTSELKVKSHVGRDLLQSAQLFRHEHQVIWEYVSNGLQYIDQGVRPVVNVKIDAKGRKIQISDNGRGMLVKDLEHYFQMHGENLERKQGRPGRGMFGTGKSAAFGIGRTLTVTTVKSGKRSKVRLTKADIEARAEGDEIPVQILEREAPVAVPNGTLVEISEIVVKNLDIPTVIRHIERHIARWPNAAVIVNNHECEYSEPDVAREIRVETKGTDYEELLGQATLIMKISKAPVEDEFRGIAILSDGVWHETTLAGCEKKPFSEYIFGTLDVAALAADTSDIPPFDMSRSMKLNPKNEVVAEIIRLIGTNVDGVRRQLEREDRERRKTLEQKQFSEAGSKIADLINAHFKDWSAKLKSTIAKAGVGKDLLPEKERESVDDISLIFGDELPAIVVGHERTDQPMPPDPDPPPRPPNPRVEPGSEGDEKIGQQAGSSKKKQNAGGFEVKFEKIGESEKRAKYDRETRTIFINLEHPRIALEANFVKDKSLVEDANFLRLAYEIAFTEYAIVLAQELSAVQFYFDPQDALVELRQTIDDLSKTYAQVFH